MKKRLFLISFAFVMSCLLSGCFGEHSYVSEDPSYSYSEQSESADESTESEGSSYVPNSLVSESYSYKEFWEAYPEFLGEWKITEFCAHSRHLLHTAEYLMNNAVGEVLCISKEGVDFSGVCYSPQPNFNVGMFRFSKLDICTHGGYLDVGKVPLEDGVSYEYFTIFIDNPEIESNDEKDFGYISFCKMDDDTLFLGIDDIYFVAERYSNDD